MPPEDADHHSLAVGLGLESCMVVPIRARGLSLGAITLATAPLRRGYRPSDLSAAQDLAGRVATAIERVALYRETEQGAVRAAQHAASLRRLMEASLAVNATMSRADVLRVLTAQARRVTGADAATTRLVDDYGALAADDPAGATADHAPGPLLGAPLLGGDGRRMGEVRVTRAEGDDFTEDDESLLVSLAQTGAVASEKAQLYEVVRASEARLQALVDASPLAILELDGDGNVRSQNRAAAELFGPPDGDGPAVTFPHPADDDLAALIARVAGGETVEGAEIAGHRGDGLPVVLSVSMAPLQGEPGEPADVQGVMAVVADVTERKQLEDQVLAAQRMEAVSRLAGGLAHDFNNLLTVIRGYSELLLMQMEEDHPFREEIEQVRAAGARAADLTNQLHTISRRQVVQLEAVDVEDVVANLEPLLQRVLGDDVELSLDVPADSGAVRCDRGQLEQLLLNLAINARDAMPGGGRFSVVVERIDVGPDEGALPEGPYVRLTVSDTGVGMDAETLQHWWEPFFASTPRGRVKGLGLATVHGIVTQNGGFVRARSDRDGVTFVVDLPRAGARADRVQDDGGRAWGGDERILLVEDEDAVRAYAREVLEHHGYDVCTASSGSEALMLVRDRKEAVDLLVTDVVMPHMNGRELAGALTRIRPGLPVLFLSGYTAGVLEARGTLEPGTRFLAKPFHPDELARAVRRALDG